MHTKFLAAAAATTMALVSSNAYAAANLTNVTINGLGSSFSWDTLNGANNTVFVQQFTEDFAGIVNPRSEAINIATSEGLNSFSTLGDGQPFGLTGEAASAYQIVLNFADGATIGAIFSTADPLGTLISTSDTVGGTTYAMGGFSWARAVPSNVVSQKFARPGGDLNDYSGLFSFTVSGAVPEPTTWLMMLAGFGMIGAGLRSRGKVRTSVTYA